VLGVSGGIAAYKACYLLRMLKEAGHSVRVIPTESALEFVGKATWEALSGERVTTSVFEDVDTVAHVELGRTAELVIVAPATADLMARARSGRADDLLTATLLVATCPVIMAPAMHTQMWQHPATQANVATLRQRGVTIIEPATGRLTGADSGPGRLPEPQEIFDAAMHLANSTSPPPSSGEQITDFQGQRIVITAGGTREPIDPVRWIGNRSTGIQGLALAQAAAERGATVSLLAANVDEAVLEPIRNNPAITIVPVETTLQMYGEVRKAKETANAVIMAAAIADYRPLVTETEKVKKIPGEPTRSLELVENPDILERLSASRLPGQVIVGFAAETGDRFGSFMEYGAAKAKRKGADLLAVNYVGEGHAFGSANNHVWILNKQGVTVSESKGTKRQVAEAILDAILKIRNE
jgi:phosphopantothenoylcysteine decarboxylase/phosphopantothenate--cysteine ligase